jgi:hypothetical protein
MQRDGDQITYLLSTPLFPFKWRQKNVRVYNFANVSYHGTAGRFRIAAHLFGTVDNLPGHRTLKLHGYLKFPHQ